MNDYERRQAEELAAKRYPYSPMDVNANLRKAFIEGYEAALETVAGEFLAQVDAELAEDLGEHTENSTYGPPQEAKPAPGERQAKAEEMYMHRAEPPHVHTPACDPAFTLEDARKGAPDPKPCVQRNPPLGDWRHSYMPMCDYDPTCHFDPRKGYSQNPEDYK